MSLNDISFDKCEFFYGDWESFLQLQNKALCENDKFDCIFTSETIYNINNYKKLINIFKNLLKKTGVVYPFCHHFYSLNVIFFLNVKQLCGSKMPLLWSWRRYRTIRRLIKKGRHF